MRNKLKLFLSIALIAALSLFAFSACKKTEPEPKITYEQDGIIYTYEKEHGGFFVTGFSDGASADNLIFVESISTESVSAEVIGIAPNAFAMTDVKYVRIHSGIKSIGDYAFKHCANLQDVSFADNSLLNDIGDYAFAYCKKLAKFDLGQNTKLTKLGGSAFRGNTALEEIRLPASLTIVGEYCFSDSYNVAIYIAKSASEVQSLISSGSWSAVWNKDGAQNVYYA